MWRRVATVGVCFLWGLIEYSMQSPFWASIFIGMGGVAFWKLFLDDETRQKLDEDNDESNAQ